MNYYLDTEFDGHSGPLISIALVREDGYSVYIITSRTAQDEWVVNNVLPVLDNHRADEVLEVPEDYAGQILKSFIGNDSNPTIIADSVVDIGRFCRAVSTSQTGTWESVDCPIIEFRVHDVASYPTELAGATQHNALWDALALKYYFEYSESA